MNRDHVEVRVNLPKGIDFITQAAFHEAGHAAAIYLRNRYYNLPQIRFGISLLGLKQPKFLDNRGMFLSNGKCHARLEGGLLVENQALSASPYELSQAILNYQHYCEADVVNLLAGPLAEAKHVAERDGEHINQHLVDYEALKNYGGKSDQEKIEEYLDGFKLPPAKKAEKLKELHALSFKFINQAHHWRAISVLANYILDNEKEIIAYEEVAVVLEAAMSKQGIDLAVVKSSRAAETIERDSSTGKKLAQTQKIQSCFNRLSNREKEVLQLIISNHSNKAAAKILKVSCRTIESHRARIMNKMQANNIVALVAMVLGHELMNQPVEVVEVCSEVS